ncbi:MAG TPA: IS110 family transposase [Chloroflexota bacterium]|nr:IS110 family transposase [Chloroflexota bacterium]
MDVLHRCCCGVDVHKASVVACLIAPRAGGAPCKEVRTFGTMTEDLLQLVDWLVAAGCTAVAMESTGSYWKPLYNLLEGVVEQVLVVNAAHIKQVPGRKTDVKDAEWIADLLRHGLLRASFIPDRPQRELRELTRYRTSLIRERAAEVNRVQKVLEGANIKLAAVASDLTGVSGRAMLAALLDGHMDAAAMAQLAQGKLRAKIPQLEQALVGQFGAHQRFMIAQQLVHIDTLDEIIARVSVEIAERVHPFAQEIAQLDSITGVGQRTAEAVVAEVGVDMTRFPTADHLTSWAGLAPGNNESAGKRRSGKTRKGSPWLRAVLIEAAHAAGRTKDTYLGAQYRRLLARKGKKRAAVAVARSILVIAYHILRDHEPYHDLGASYLDQRDRQAVERRLVRRLEALGYDVSLQPKEPAA